MLKFPISRVSENCFSSSTQRVGNVRREVTRRDASLPSRFVPPARPISLPSWIPCSSRSSYFSSFRLFLPLVLFLFFLLVFLPLVLFLFFLLVFLPLDVAIILFLHFVFLPLVLFSSSCSCSSHSTYFSSSYSCFSR